MTSEILGFQISWFEDSTGRRFYYVVTLWQPTGLFPGEWDVTPTTDDRVFDTEKQAQQYAQEIYARN